ncbi:hypothetical protein L226DRAFT_396419 [Lentinus tigrinus ALCF2SS1-7]|uniref:uncharacterized protein n=1 Tax=Lentinus tigrinus ALCF2SS1-7 TaxID=1328758 RepID=UPI001165D60D|nr:hypothetical protein L226DRAFT_396419 [Lentinus tigrinus ALCF2SS1-7]
MRAADAGRKSSAQLPALSQARVRLVLSAPPPPPDPDARRPTPALRPPRATPAHLPTTASASLVLAPDARGHLALPVPLLGNGQNTSPLSPCQVACASSHRRPDSHQQPDSVAEGAIRGANRPDQSSSALHALLFRDLLDPLAPLVLVPRLAYESDSEDTCIASLRFAKLSESPCTRAPSVNRCCSSVTGLDPSPASAAFSV